LPNKHDTDCGIDDLRAISLLLARPEITIKAIVTSDGSLAPKEGAEKVSSLLNAFNKSITLSAADCISETLYSENENVILVCLGPLTNVAKAIKKDPDLISRIERIVWYNESAKPLQGFNYECDKESTAEVIKSPVRLDIISNLDREDALFDSSLIADCNLSQTVLAKVLHNGFRQDSVIEKLNEKQFSFYDELVVLYITNPELFSITTELAKLNIRYNKDYDVQGIKAAISDMIWGRYVSERNVVLNRFPLQPEMYNYDIRPMMDSTIARYGYDEWKACVITNEFHRHLGVFSIVGTKMGIKARDYFGVGLDQLEVTTYAGSIPPYSCMNDGLQVSTGATLGMGTIHLADKGEAQAAALFTYRNRSVRISLKPEYLAQAEANINEGIVKYGLLDFGYWKLIRHNAIKYWLEWDRNEIFDLGEI
jgi:pyrimidine-specific ribonucleoside hydrolase